MTHRLFGENSLHAGGPQASLQCSKRMLKMTGHITAVFNGG